MVWESTAWMKKDKPIGKPKSITGSDLFPTCFMDLQILIVHTLLPFDWFNLWELRKARRPATIMHVC